MTVATREDIVDAEVIRSAPEWADLIRADLGRAVEGIVSAGRHLIAAKADVQHGEWLPLLQEVGISARAAQELMSIGANESLSNARNCSHLPAAARSLYELSRLDPEVIEAGIEHGDIHPAMTIKDAKGYAAEVTERGAPANVNAETGEIAHPATPAHDTEKEVAIVNDLRLYLRHIGTDKAITGMSTKAKQYVIEALEEAAANLKESM